MGVLFLVRHGQASYGSEDYDRLSPLGEEQARRLAAWWVKSEIRIDAVYTGPLERQRRSAEVSGRTYAGAGLPWPEPIVLEGLAEYDGDALVRGTLPLLADHDEEIREILRRMQGLDEGSERMRFFDRLLQAVLRRWTEGAAVLPGVETWREFRGRVADTLRTMTDADERGRRVVAFTSGGVIGAAVGHALETGDRATLELGWTTQNSAFAEMLFSGDRIGLARFNACPHLDDPELWTYR